MLQFDVRSFDSLFLFLSGHQILCLGGSFIRWRQDARLQAPWHGVYVPRHHCIKIVQMICWTVSSPETRMEKPKICGI
jgi:hypothetical protein